MRVKIIYFIESESAKIFLSYISYLFLYKEFCFLLYVNYIFKNLIYSHRLEIEKINIFIDEKIILFFYIGKIAFLSESA